MMKMLITSCLDWSANRQGIFVIHTPRRCSPNTIASEYPSTNKSNHASGMLAGPRSHTVLKPIPEMKTLVPIGSELHAIVYPASG